MSSNDHIKVIDCKASDNEYLHKDFHGALCYAIKYLGDTYGDEAVTEYLEQVARTYFAPLIEAVKKEGLGALRRHFEGIFKLEGGEVAFSEDGETLTLEVKECPAIAHLVKNDLLYTDRYCETTVVVNKTICEDAGYACSCSYEPGKGRCVQKFWKA